MKIEAKLMHHTSTRQNKPTCLSPVAPSPATTAALPFLPFLFTEVTAAAAAAAATATATLETATLETACFGPEVDIEIAPLPLEAAAAAAVDPALTGWEAATTFPMNFGFFAVGVGTGDA